jgi:hypothetical protein
MRVIRDDWFALSNQNKRKGQPSIHHNTHDRKSELDKYFGFHTLRYWRWKSQCGDCFLSGILEKAKTGTM